MKVYYMSNKIISLENIISVEKVCYNNHSHDPFECHINYAIVIHYANDVYERISGTQKQINAWYSEIVTLLTLSAE